MRYAYLAMLVTVFLLVPAIPMPARADAPVLANAPIWAGGEWWQFNTTYTTNEVATMDDGLGGTLTQTTTWVNDITKYTLVTKSTVNTYLCYDCSITGTTRMLGTWTDVNPLFGSISGTFDATATNTGHEYRRTTDLAFVKSQIHSSVTVHTYDDTGTEMMGSPSTQNQDGTTTANVPLVQFQFPLHTDDT